MNQLITGQLYAIFRNKYVIIVTAFLIVNSTVFYIHGVKIVNDTERYIEYATNLHSGFYFDPHNFWYIGYSLYILLIQILQGDLLSIVIGQYFLSFLAVIALYHTSLLIWDNKWSALFTALCYLIFIDISSWNSYILTESLYTSFTCFSLYCLTRVAYGKASIGFVMFMISVVLLTIFIKPTGIALAGAVLGILTTKLLGKISNRFVYLFLLSVVVGIFLYLVNQRLSTYLIMENYQLGEVIYGVTTITDRTELKALILLPPENIYIPSESLPPLLKIILFFFHHPWYWLKLFYAKAYYLLLHIRPFWSLGHNVFSLVILIPSYCFFLKVLLTDRPKMDTFLFSVIYLLIHLLSVCMTSEDWDGRFLMPMLPVIFIFTGHGVATWLSTLKVNVHLIQKE